MDGTGNSAEFSRIPTLDDLAELCRNLNNHQVKYVVIGGFAVIHSGYVRATGDIDILVDPVEDNIRKIKKALAYIKDGCVEDIGPGDIADYSVVRICGEITVDILGKACDVDYKMADKRDGIKYEIINGVEVPFLSAHLLIKTKQGSRPKDIQDRMFLERLIKG